MRICVRMVLLGVWLCGVAAWAQDAATGALRGEIDGPDGVAVGGAVVTLWGPDGRFMVHVGRTGADGVYQVPALEPGRYEMSVTAAGFANDAPFDVTIALGETAQMDVLLRSGIAQSVTVRGEALPAPDMFASPMDTTVKPDEVQALPIEGRRWQDLAAVAPMIAPAGSGDARVSAAGIAVTQNTYTLDGVRDTRMFSGAPRGSQRLSLGNAQGGVREFRVVTSATGGDLEGVGAAFHVVTRSASSHRGGTLFVQSRSNLFAAVDPSALVTRYNGGAPTVAFAKPQDTRVQWGATGFGAVPHVRSLLGHVAFEEEHRSFPAVSSPASASFYALSAKQVMLLQTRGVTVEKQHEALEYLDSLSGAVARTADEWSVLPRLDWNLNTKTALSFTWSHASRTSPAGLRGQTVVHRGTASFGDDRIVTDAVIARWSQEMSSRVTNRLVFGFSRDMERQEAQASLPQEPHTGPNGFSPQVSLGGDFVFGKPGSLGRRRYPDERRVQVTDTWTYAARGWALRAGADTSLTEEQVSSLSNEEGSYAYANSTAAGHAGALVDWMTDWAFPSTSDPNGACPAIYAAVHSFCFRTFTQSFGAQDFAFRTGELSGFAQAHWQPAASLAVTAGVRYETFALPAAQHPNAALDALFGDAATTSRLPRDENNVAPYASIAWGTKKTAVRVGAGIHYGRVAGATIWAALSRTALPESTRTIHIAPWKH